MKLTSDLVVMSLILVALVFLFTLMLKQSNAIETIGTECKPTNLFVIGYKGHINRVLDCTGVEKYKIK